MNHARRNQYDITNRVRISHPGAVCAATVDLVEKHYPQHDLRALRKAFETFTRLYAGTLPGYRGCDTWYHDAQHSLDCTLAMARLVDGHEGSAGETQKLGARRAVLGIVIALFHDAGYIRRDGDEEEYGAEFTLNHVRRSGEFLAKFLPRIGYAREADATRQIVHFTGYEIALDKIRVEDPKDRMLGFMLGTADILAQTSDRCYLEKCRDYLFREFSFCGLAGPPSPGRPPTTYPTPETLLLSTPEFNRHLWEDRLDGYFGGVHRYMSHHFGGRNPYVEQIHEHLDLVERLGRHRQFHKLRRRPYCVDAKALRRLLGIKGKAPAERHDRRHAPHPAALGAALPLS